MKKQNYLFVLASPSYEAALIAWKTARDLNLRVSGQTGNNTLELHCTADDAERFYATGLFSMYTAKSVKNEHLKKLSPEVQTTIDTWNQRFSAEFLKAKTDKSKQGLNWTAEGLNPPAPYAPADPLEIINKAIAIRKKQKKDVSPKSVKPSLKVSYEKLNEKDEEMLLEFFRQYAKDSKLTYAAFQLFYRSKKEFKPFFLDIEWIKIILEILHQYLHDLEQGEASCLKMHGRNSVGIVFVESSRRGGPKFTNAERSAIENEIKSGLSFLVGEHPSGNLIWVYDVQKVKIDVANKENTNDSDTTYDGYWRLPALEQVNFEGHTYSADNSSMNEYRADMRAHHQSQHATIIFISAFGMSWHAYSSGRQHIAMGPHGNNWGGWGQNEVNIITAHEMSHQFGAADEYTGSGTPCSSCGGEHGCDNIPNGNCGTCAKPQIGCIMHNHELNICNYTRGQIGWADIFVELRTSNDWWSGTDDSVRLDIGHRTFNLDTPDHNDRESGNREGYAIWAGGELSRSSIKRILIRKSADGFAGGWKLQRIKVWHQGELICDESPNVWLEDRKTWFLAKTFDNTLVNVLKLKVSTADAMWAGTDDDVTLKLAGRSWNVDSDDNDFERGASKTYDLDPGTGLSVASLNSITIKKSPDGIAGGWKLKGLKLTVNGTVKYENNSINRWLEGNDRTFSDAI